MEVPTTAGKALMLVVGWPSRKLLSDFWHAADAFIETSDPTLLNPFDGKTVNVEGVEIPLMTDRRLLTKLYKEGRMSFESLYAKGMVA
jgi:hypothetical protein